MKRIFLLVCACACGLGCLLSSASAEHCQPYWTAAYKCAQGCGPCGGASGPVYAPPAPSPEQLAFARSRSSYVNVLRVLSESLPFFSGASWMADLPDTPERYAEDANSLHRYLVSTATAFTLQSKAYRDIQAIYASLTPLMTADAGSIAGKIPHLQEKAKEARGYLPWYQAQIDNLNGIRAELLDRSNEYLNRTRRDQQVVQGAFRLLLPGGSIPPIGAGSVAEAGPAEATRMPADPDFVVGREIQSIFPGAMPALPDTNTQPRPAGVAGLGGSLEARAAQLDADAQVLRQSFDLRNHLMQQNQEPQRAFETASSSLAKTRQAHNDLVDEILGLRSRVADVHRAELAASDALHSEEARFVTYAAQAWIWQNAKTVVLNALKVELKTNRYFSTHSDIARSPFLDVSEADILKYYSERKFNVMNLPDTFETSAGLNKVKNSIVTLLTHGEGYATEAVNLAALGSETDTREFVGGLYGGMRKDSEDLVKQGMNTISVPEPFSTVMTKYFLGPLP